MGIFDHFCLMGIFSKKIRLSHIMIYEPLTPCQVSEKTNEPIRRKLTGRPKDGRAEGRMEGRLNGIYFKNLI